MRASLGSLLGVGLLLTVSACKGKGDSVQDVCELALSCDCTPAAFPDVDSCVTKLNDEVERIKAVAVANDLIFDADCVDDLSAQYVSFGCEVSPKSDACTICSPVHGTQPAGAACTKHDDFYDCAQDLLCINGVCLDPCNRIPEDGVCAVMKDGVTQGTGNCADGLYCDSQGTLTCKPRSGVGEPCPTFSNCADGLTCNGVTCEKIPGEGETCLAVCEPEFVCDTGVCKPAPGEGEPCPIGACTSDSQCDTKTMFCVARQPLVCGIDPQ